jgi:hypothetical protein
MSSDIKSTDIRLMNQFLELLKRKDAGKLSHKQVSEGLQLIMTNRTNALVWDDASEAVNRNGVLMTREFLAQTMELRGQVLKRHPNGGGWVPMLQDRDDELMPYVAETVVVGPFAMVYEQARVMDRVEIWDFARVHGRSYLETNASVAGYGEIRGTAWGINRATIDQYALVEGDARLQGSTHVTGHAYVRDALVCSLVVDDNVRIIGNAVKNGKTVWDKFVYDKK